MSASPAHARSGRISLDELVTRTLARFASALGRELDAEISGALSEMGPAIALDHVFLAQLSPDAERWSITHEWCAHGVEGQKDALKDVPADRYAFSASELLAGHTVRINRLAEYPPSATYDRDSAQRYGTRSLLLQPIRRGAAVCGAIGFETVSHERVWSDDEVHLLEQVAHVLSNVLERQRAELALERSEARLKAITDLSPDVISIIDESGELLFNSPAAERIHGYSREELMGQNTALLWHPEDASQVERAFHEILANPGKSGHVEYRYRNKDGSYTWMEAVGVSQPDNPALRGVVVLSRDVSDRKREEQRRRELELKVQQMQKLESLGVLAGGVAHDFNNLLVAIIGNLDLALARLPRGDPSRELLSSAMSAADRAAGLARQMLAYAGRSRLELEQVDLRALVEDTARLLACSIPAGLDLRLECPSEVPPILADPAQLRQAIMNLILNAAEALPSPSGTILARVGSLLCDREYLSSGYVDEGLPAGEYAFVDIEDTGTGMEEATLRRIFDPFFSTKFAGRGLGLPSVLGIVRSHRGAVHVSSAPGEGTRVRALFPVFRRARRDDPAGMAAPERASSGRGEVLLVDDEPGVREAGSALLAYLGFRASLAADGLEALRFVARRAAQPGSAPLRAIILDLSMPAPDGCETLRRLRAMGCTTPVLISSGYGEEEAIARLGDLRPSGFMRKPYGIEALADSLERVFQHVL